MMKSRNDVGRRIIPSQAYWCNGLFGVRHKTRKQGKAARIGKKMLERHLEVSRILKKLTHTKAALGLMLLPGEQALRKANRKLFPVHATNQYSSSSDSTSEEE